MYTPLRKKEESAGSRKGQRGQEGRGGERIEEEGTGGDRRGRKGHWSHTQVTMNRVEQSCAERVSGAGCSELPGEAQTQSPGVRQDEGLGTAGLGSWLYTPMTRIWGLWPWGHCASTEASSSSEPGEVRETFKAKEGVVELVET